MYYIQIQVTFKLKKMVTQEMFISSEMKKVEGFRYILMTPSGSVKSGNFFSKQKLIHVIIDMN